MSSRKDYNPGPAEGAEIQKTDGDRWTLVLIRELSHSPEKVWQALTDPQQLSEWAPYDADRNLGTVGPAKLTTAGNVSETEVVRAEAPRVLECKGVGTDIRWELEEMGQGTRLKLWHSIDRRYISMGAAGWHVCIDVLDRLIGGEPIGRLTGEDALKFDGWQRLNKEYAQQFGMEAPKW